MCRRWARLTRSAAALWESVELTLTLPDPSLLERIECFLEWLIPRAAAVEKLSILAERGEGAPTTAAPIGPLHHQLVWSNLVSALTLMGPTLRHLTIDWPDDLQLSAWVATLVALEVRWRGRLARVALDLVLFFAGCGLPAVNEMGVPLQRLGRLSCGKSRGSAVSRLPLLPPRGSSVPRAPPSSLPASSCCRCNRCSGATDRASLPCCRSLAASQPPASQSAPVWAAWRRSRCGCGTGAGIAAGKSRCRLRRHLSTPLLRCRSAVQQLLDFIAWRLPHRRCLALHLR